MSKHNLLIRQIATRKNYSPGLDNVRALAILFGLLWHFLQIEQSNAFLNIVLSSGPWGGANPLFLISGYLLGNQILSRYVGGKKVSLSRFYFRRALKTWPNYFVLIFIAFQIPILQHEDKFESVWNFLTFTQNFNLSHSALSHTWSLCIEEHFYLVLPLVSLLFLKRPKFTTVTTIVAVIILGGIFLRGSLWFEYLQLNDTNRFREYFNKIYYPTFNRLDGLLLGVYLAYIQNYAPEIWKKILNNGEALFKSGLLLCLLGFLMQIQRTSLISALLVFPVLSFGFAGIMIGSLNSSSSISRFRMPSAARIATISYALYIVHKPVANTVKYFLRDQHLSFSQDLFLSVLLGYAGSFALAILLYLAVEKPFLKLRDKFIPDIES